MGLPLIRHKDWYLLVIAPDGTSWLCGINIWPLLPQDSKDDVAWVMFGHKAVSFIPCQNQDIFLIYNLVGRVLCSTGVVIWLLSSYHSWVLKLSLAHRGPNQLCTKDPK